MKQVKKAQGSLEYLIIIAAVISISAIVIFLVTGSAGNSEKNVLYSSCRQAAVECGLLHKANPNNTCQICDESCVDPRNGEELEQCIIKACKLGNSSIIYQGANISSLGACSVDSDCNDSDPCTNDSCEAFNGDVCNMSCTHTQITAKIDGDGCCVGGNHNTDSDCDDNPPTLSNGRASTTSGLTNTNSNSSNRAATYFPFIVTYSDPDNDAPNYVNVTINGTDYSMSSSCTDYVNGCDYSLSKAFDAPSNYHSFSFKSLSGQFLNTTSGGSVLAYVCADDNDCHSDTTCKNYSCNDGGTYSATCTWVAKNEGGNCGSSTTSSCNGCYPVTTTNYYKCSGGSCVFDHSDPHTGAKCVGYCSNGQCYASSCAKDSNCCSGHCCNNYCSSTACSVT